MPHLRRRRRRAATALAVALPALAVAPATASAADGAATIDFRQYAVSWLRAKGVRISAGRPAKGGPRRVVLPVADGSTTRRLVHRGTVTLSRKAGRRTRAVTFTAWQTRVTARRATLSARIGRRRVPVFVATYRPKARTVRGDAVTLARSTTRLTPVAARILRRTLALPGLNPILIGRTRVKANVATSQTDDRSSGGSGSPGTGGGSGGTGGSGSTPAPGSPACHGFGSESVPVASPPLTRPAEAGPVSAATFWWSPKDSWMRYINSGYRPGDGVHASDGAVPDRPAADTVVYRYAFSLDPARPSWFDGGTGALYFKGSVRFRWADHGLDITVSDPEVEINGASSRLVFRFTGSECSTLRNQRVDFARLAVGVPRRSGLTYDYGRVPATITEAGAGAFSGMYAPNSEWGAIELSFRTG